MLKGMEFRIYPNRIQENIIQKTFGCSRVVYNSGLALRIEEKLQRYMKKLQIRGMTFYIKSQQSW